MGEPWAPDDYDVRDAASSERFTLSLDQYDRWLEAHDREVLESIDTEVLGRLLYELTWQPDPVGVPWEALAEHGPNRRKYRDLAEAVKAHLLGGAS